MTAPQATVEPAESPGRDPGDAAGPWSRLDPRMLLVHPLRELLRYLPVLLIVLVAGAAAGENWWTYALSGLGMAIGVARWFTTTFRMTSTHVQVRSGILNRRTRSVPRENIRSVDADSTPLHRIFGLSIVRVATGASHGQDGLEFNAVPSRSVPALRAELLRAAPPEVDAPPENLSAWHWSWTRYAPFTLTGVAALLAVAVFALQLQFFDGGILTRLPWVRQALASLARVPTAELAAWTAGALILLASVVAVARYLWTYADFTIFRADATTLHVSRGLIHTRQVTLDETRMRGVQLSEPLSLRLAGAASTRAIMTGIGVERGGETVLSPPGPRADARDLAGRILDTDDPLTCPLIGHGRAARRRRYTRAAVFTATLALAATALEVLGLAGPSVWLLFVVIVPGMAVLAWDRARGLGHALLPGWLVTQHGSFLRSRAVLATAGIIGWTIRRSLFQRRAGLATLVATTAAGRHRYEIVDLPMEQVRPLIDAVSLLNPTPSCAISAFPDGF